MNVVIKIATKQVISFIESRNYTLAIQLTSDRTYVKRDERRLIQVISNLLTNAAKYTSPGENIYLLLSATNEGVCTEISDNGLGIEPDAQKVIFDIFEQVHLYFRWHLGRFWDWVSAQSYNSAWRDGFLS